MPRTFLVIDIQNDYFSGGALPLWQAAETEARIIAAIAQARSGGDKVVLVQHISKDRTGLFANGAPGTALRPAILAAAADAPIITKRYADAFQDTELAKHLDVDSELLICGMMTQNCVVFTAMSAVAESFQRRVVADLCTAPTEPVHRIAVSALRSKLDVVTVEEAFV
ncbi:isochorismatase family protein [Aureimonas sp. AU20]|uniref:isochorismatase family protein n=1 Tax=Aureimonas sp. AU20 TaxID=1349819 RepID=UPI000721FB2C|nr:isochorismatase family protein [Aureimonas sp. AU20]ALN75708.1 hypothetical protein M673_23465 [Aureimonas sp. AU20]